jgi:hypothetical protein
MARNTCLSYVGAGKRERSSAVVEGSRAPCCSTVTTAAGVTEIVNDVIRILGTGEVGLVARVTVCRRTGIRGRVANIAGSGRVRSGQYK